MPERPKRGRRYVLSIRPTGLGDRLVSLGAAWLFASRTDRTLVADWRGGAYAGGRRDNIFARCFAVPEQLAGMPFIGDDSVAGLRLPVPRYPARWLDDGTLAQPFGRPAADIEADRDAAVAMIRSGADRPEPVVVFDGCINDGLVRLSDAATFFSALTPHPRIAALTEDATRRLPPPPWIGLHARHGNGGPTGSHARHWADGEAAIARCAAAVAEARRRLGEAAPVVIATDASTVVERLQAAIPNSHARPKQFRAPGAGDLHTGPGADAMLDDALVEMALLGRSAMLVRHPAGSFFSLPAAVAIAVAAGSVGSVYDLLAPWTPDDPMAPAIVGPRGSDLR